MCNATICFLFAILRHRSLAVLVAIKERAKCLEQTAIAPDPCLGVPIANSDLRVILVTSVQLQLHKGEGQIMLRNTSWNCYAARRRRRPLERGSQKIPQHLRPRPFNKRCWEGIFLSSTIWLQLSFQCLGNIENWNGWNKNNQPIRSFPAEMPSFRFYWNKLFLSADNSCFLRKNFCDKKFKRQTNHIFPCKNTLVQYFSKKFI